MWYSRVAQHAWTVYGLYGLQLTGRPVRVLRMVVIRMLVVWQVRRCGRFGDRSGGLRRRAFWCAAENDVVCFIRVRCAAEKALDRGKDIREVVGGIPTNVCLLATLHASSTLEPDSRDVSNSSRPIPDA